MKEHVLYEIPFEPQNKPFSGAHNMQVILSEDNRTYRVTLTGPAAQHLGDQLKKHISGLQDGLERVYRKGSPRVFKGRKPGALSDLTFEIVSNPDSQNITEMDIIFTGTALPDKIMGFMKLAMKTFFDSEVDRNFKIPDPKPSPDQQFIPRGVGRAGRNTIEEVGDDENLRFTEKGLVEALLSATMNKMSPAQIKPLVAHIFESYPKVESDIRIGRGTADTFVETLNAPTITIAQGDLVQRLKKALDANGQKSDPIVLVSIVQTIVTQTNGRGRI